MKKQNQTLLDRRIEAYSKYRRNFSPEAENIMRKLYDGKEISPLEVFILSCDDKRKIEQYKKFYDIREKINNGNISYEQLELLSGELQIDDEDLKMRLIETINEKNENNYQLNKKNHN